MTTHQLDNDPLECRAMLAESLADPALACFAKGILPDDASRHAAYIVAVSIGRCRLFGIGTDREMDGALPLAVAHAAVQWMFLGVCHGLRAGANGLPKRLNEAIAVEAEDLCLDLLAGRLNAWAAQVALEEAYRAEDDGAELDAKKLAGALDSLAGELLLVDDALRAVAIELTLAASGYLLENWRGLLAPEYVEIAPCWLTGELAQLAAQLAEQESEPFLDKDAWNIARRAIRAKRVGAAIAANAEAVESSEEMEMAQPAGEDSPDDGLAPNNMDGDLTDAGYEEEEMAIAADDGGGLDGPTPAEQRSIQYLTVHLPEILRHGNSDVWLAIDSEGAFTAHTYDGGRAAGYANNLGPVPIPFVFDPSNMIERNVKDVLAWMVDFLKLHPRAAEQVCHNLQWWR